MKKLLSVTLLVLLLSTSYNVNAGVSTSCFQAVHSLIKVFKPTHNKDLVNPKNLKKYKYMNMAQALLFAHSGDNTPFVRIIPTDSCNLRCSYCFQFNKDPYQMTIEQFTSYLEKGKKSHVGMMTFLGGEPMTWKHLYTAIEGATRAHILTDMTTNGTLLNKKSIDRLGKSGLDFLNISVDGVKKSLVSKKTSVIERKELIGYLKEAEKKYGMKTRINSVIHKGNFDDIKQLIEFSKENDIPISLGFVVPHSSGEQVAGHATYFHQEDTELLNEIIEYIIAKKKAGYRIIDPEEYFEGMHKYIKREEFWSCNYPTRYGWVNVTPRGGIRSCTKKMDQLKGMDFLSLDAMKLKEMKSTLRTMVNKCNKDCYSNCAFDSWFYKTHKFKAIKKALGME